MNKRNEPYSGKTKRILAKGMMVLCLGIHALLMLPLPSVQEVYGETVVADSVEAFFSCEAPGAESVFIAGSFNGWRPDVAMARDNKGVWRASVSLRPGFYYYKFVVDGKWIPDPANPTKVNDGGDSLNSILKVGDPPLPKRKAGRLGPLPVDALPRPVLDGNPEWIDLYDAAWRMAWDKISFGTEENGFVERYMDEGFNEMIFQWDTVFMTLFGMYGRQLFPAMPSLDNFYRKQRRDGYIQRVYFEETGEQVDIPTTEEPVVNPPLFAWAELRYARLSGDTSRVRRVLPALMRYSDWIDATMRGQYGQGLYYNTGLGSGMDNSPRPDIDQAAWVDMSAQQALAARCIAELAELAGDEAVKDRFTEHHARIVRDIRRLCWDEDDGFYYDRTRGNTLCASTHIGAFWTLLGGVADPFQAARMVGHLKDPSQFWRPHLVPTLAADDPSYQPKGHYWRGSVWAPTNYMVVKGLEMFGYYDVAAEIAENHIGMMSRIYRDFVPDEERIAVEERYGDGYHTIWECYSPEYPEPATRWDNTFYSRQDFVGWSGLGPIAMLMENVIGLEIDGLNNTIRWRIHRLDRHGIENIQLGDQMISLVCHSRLSSSDPVTIDVACEKPFALEVLSGSRMERHELAPGRSTVTIR